MRCRPQTTTMPIIENISDWLIGQLHETGDGRYRHLLLRENTSRWRQVADGLRAYYRAAHEDAMRHYRALAGNSLDPLGRPRGAGPEDTYPHGLHELDKQGYLGEVFAAIVAENFAPHGHDGWVVPAFLFRFHTVAFERLEAVYQSGQTANRVPGRTGDDCLAFLRDHEGRIIKVLYCEAKCTGRHDAGLIADGHRKVSTAEIVNILQLVEVLEDRAGIDAVRWVEALRQFRFRTRTEDWERCDLVCYVCGQVPIQQPTWMPTERPHKNYTASRRLEAVEIHLRNVSAMLQHVYSEVAWR
jgi:hypothetical protein